MAFRFRRSVRVLPGVRVNFTTRGISTTLGPRGFSLNVGKRGTHLNVGLPGTGLSVRSRLDPSPALPVHPEVPIEPEPSVPPSLDALPSGAVEIASAALEDLGDEGTAVLKNLITEAFHQRSAAEADLKDTAQLVRTAERRLARARAFFFRWFLAKRIPEREAAVAVARADHEEAQRRIDTAIVDVDFDMTPACRERYADVVAGFRALTNASAIWDITSRADVDRQRTRSSASHEVTRRPVALGIAELPAVRSEFPALRFGNANGEEIYIFPAVAIMGRPGASFAVVDMRTLSLEYQQSLFVERDTLPGDAELAHYTWEKVNKSGQPDRRFKDNREIPVMWYGTITLSTVNGLREAYLVSSKSVVETFGRAFVGYQMELPRLSSDGVVAETTA